MRGRLTRRRVLGLAGALGAGLVASACGTGEATSDASPSAATSAGSGDDAVLRFSNWPSYIDISEDGAPTTLDDFLVQTGIAVEYTEDINDGSEFYAKVRLPLEGGQDIGRDLIVLSEETARVFIEEGFAAPLDYSLIPNAANLLPRFRQAAFDPGRTYTLPWQSGFTGFGWNAAGLKERLGVDRLTSFEQFFDERLAGRVAILSETMDSMGLLLAWQGFDPEQFTDAEFEQTLDVLRTYIDDGTIRQVAGNDYLGGLESGDLIASLGWSGDVLALGDGFGFGLPESGGLVWADSMLIPVVSPHKANAERLMDFYYDPVNAARLAAYIQYTSPVAGTREAMASVDPALVDDPWIFPPEEVLDAAYVTQNLSMERSQLLDRRFDSVAGA